MRTLDVAYAVSVFLLPGALQTYRKIPGRQRRPIPDCTNSVKALPHCVIRYTICFKPNLFQILSYLYKHGDCTDRSVVVYAHGRRLCCNCVRHGSTTISYPKCSLTFMRERYLHSSCAYAKSAVGIDVVSAHKLFAYRVVSTVSKDIVSSHTKYCRIA